MNIQLIGIDEDAFQAATEEQRIEWGKRNWTAFDGLCESAKAWIITMRGNVIGEYYINRFTSGWAMTHTCIPKVVPDYQPVRWIFHPESRAVDWTYDKTIKLGWIEVTADYAAYVRNKPDGECELRKPEGGDEFWTNDSAGSEWNVFHTGGYLCGMLNYRWCKPKPKAGWVEYEVTVHNGIYGIRGFGNMQDKSHMRLSHAADRVGFGGVQFEGQQSCDVWFGSTVMFAGCGDLYRDACPPDMMPATPVRARFWQYTKGGE